MTINGEKVWVPDNRSGLIAGLKRMKVYEVDGMRLDRLPKAQLLSAYCRERYSSVCRHQREQASADGKVDRVAQDASASGQLELFAMN